MNLNRTLLTTALLTALAVTPVFAAKGGNGNGAGDGTGICTTCTTGTVDAKEAATLTFMREEEKLARDFYRAANELWPTALFVNIAAAEQQHMDAIARMLTKYRLPDPVATDIPGHFVDQTLQQFYDQLTARARTSQIEALQAGGLIEEVDIEDNQNAIDATDNLDLKVVYGNLLRGSRNHLRALVREIERQGGEYTAQHLDQATVDVIVDSPMERGGRGDGTGTGGRGDGTGIGGRGGRN